ncbi:hypothetical protein QK291_07405 [Arthrobacter sp. AL12]|nr:hypothetical protein [Arthrobacter sp. AL12]
MSVSWAGEHDPEAGLGSSIAAELERRLVYAGSVIDVFARRVDQVPGCSSS